MKWPARSPDLNPIELQSNALGRCAAALNPPTQTLLMLITTLEEQWLEFPSELTDHLINNITHFCMGCISSRVIILHIKGTFHTPN